MKYSALAIAIMACGYSNADILADTLPLKVTLAQDYQSDIDFKSYWVSEKLDGIRAVWDGEKLLTRNGNPIYAPTWFVEGLPKEAIEGELWAGRGNFHVVQQTVLDHVPSDEAWKQISLMVFDAPDAKGDYPQRYLYIQHWVEQANVSHVRYVKHQQLSDELALFRLLNTIESEKGEGVMLRAINTPYIHGRSEALLKLKPYQDAEATVIGYTQGKGKYQGQVGALIVQTEDGTEFNLGSGLSDEMRQEPLPIGTVITYRFNGYTHKGLPKFARLLRERIEK
ncbi:DNA ligase [Vibrio sp. SCSIO 43136]|uniref:DNA ligase n=1 Tax=Vibrio sp. SCSIO 43136 TaxID=2819101 RepID=UPI0020758483|nr:DNA ligase [Vibrio sp. SCSIO 43136]USD66661.1 DNA ligase [Vibrio sp. SCSIO 43136]